jgi:hypothetical protein
MTNKQICERQLESIHDGIMANIAEYACMKGISYDYALKFCAQNFYLDMLYMIRQQKIGNHA